MDSRLSLAASGQEIGDKNKIEATSLVSNILDIPPWLHTMVEERNPVTSETVTDLLSKICPGITLTKSELDDYTSILGRLQWLLPFSEYLIQVNVAATHDNYQAILEREDWNPPVDISRFPRENVRYPTKEEDPHGIWAWKCSIKDHGEKASKGLLAGKRICYKVWPKFHSSRSYICHSEYIARTMSLSKTFHVCLVLIWSRDGHLWWMLPSLPEFWRYRNKFCQDQYY